jgi:hypothetical protein
MTERRQHFRSGITLIELLIAAIAATILVVGITGILAAAHQNFKSMLKRTSKGVVPDAYVAQKAFDRFVRKSSIKRYDPSTADVTPSNYLYVYYYSVPQNLLIENPDSYGHFYLNGTTLMLQTGTVTGNFGRNPAIGLPDLSNPTATFVLAENVTSVSFKVFMYSVEMTLVLDNENPPGSSANKLETLKMTVTSTAILHNDWH